MAYWDRQDVMTKGTRWLWPHTVAAFLPWYAVSQSTVEGKQWWKYIFQCLVSVGLISKHTSYLFMVTLGGKLWWALCLINEKLCCRKHWLKLQTERQNWVCSLLLSRIWMLVLAASIIQQTGKGEQLVERDSAHCQLREDFWSMLPVVRPAPNTLDPMHPISSPC